MGWREPRQMLTAVLRLCGQAVEGPTGEVAQSMARVRSPISPPPARKERSALGARMETGTPAGSGRGSGNSGRDDRSPLVAKWRSRSPYTPETRPSWLGPAEGTSDHGVGSIGGGAEAGPIISLAEGEKSLGWENCPRQSDSNHLNKLGVFYRGLAFAPAGARPG